MKKFTYWKTKITGFILGFLMILFFGQFSYSQTTLIAGDIAIIGANYDAPDEFAFVLLVDIESGTEIRFTDSGWLSAGSFRGGEGGVKYTAPSAQTAGTIITYTAPASGDWAVDNDATIGTNGMSLSGSGDQIFAFQGLSTVPNFIFGYNSEGTGWQADATSSNTTALPVTLTDGTDAIALNEIDNAVYDESTTTGTQAELLAAICNIANWSGSNTVLQTMPSGPFTVTGGSTLNPPSSFSIDTVTTDKINITWTKPSGTFGTDWDSVVVYARAVLPNDAVVTGDDGSALNDGFNVYGAGTQDNNSFCVAIVGDTDGDITVTALTEGIRYYFIAYTFKNGATDDWSDATTEIDTLANVQEVSDFAASNGNTQSDITWTNPDGSITNWWDLVIVVAKEGSAVDVAPSGDPSTITANAAFSSGDDLGTGNYVVYKGTGTNETVTNLINGTTYHFKTFVYYEDVLTAHDYSSGVISDATPFEPPSLIISEVADPADSWEARFVELYNTGTTTIDFSATTVYFSRQSNGGSWADLQLTGTIGSGQTLVLATNTTNFNTAYGFDPDIEWSSVNGNGNDGYFLFLDGDNSTGTLFDAYGVVNEDGTGKPWNYLDSRAVRSNTVENPTSTWTAGEWTIASANVADFDPGTHTCDYPPITADPPTSFTATPSSSTQIDLSWGQNTNTDPVMVIFDTDGTFTDPVDGTAYTVGNTTLGGEVIFNASGISYNHLSLSNTNHYYYKAWSVDGSNNYSSGVTADASPLLLEPTIQTTNINFTAVSPTTADIEWTNGDGENRVVKINTINSFTLPVDGTEEAAGNTVYGVGEQVVFNGNGIGINVTGLSPDTEYWVQAFEYNNSGSNVDFLTSTATNNPNNFTTPEIIESEDFELGTFGNWTAYSVIGDTTWINDEYSGNKYAIMTGYDGGAYANEDWLISPALNLSDYINEVIEFRTAKNYTGDDLQLRISTTYDGISAPVLAEWTDLTVQAEWSGGSWEWITTDVDISTYNSSSVYIAFVYTCDDVNAATWEVDDIVISGYFFDVTLPTVDADLVFLSNTTVKVIFSEDVETTTAQTLTNYTLSGTGGLTLDPTVASLNGNEVTLTIEDMSGLTAGQTVIVTVSNVEDLSGNVVDAGNNTATYTKPTAPEVSPDLTYVDATHVKVIFSEDVETTTAQTTTNYTLSGTGGLTGNPGAAVLANGNEVTLTVADMSSFNQDETVIVTVINVEDLEGNPIESNNVATYIFPDVTAPIVTFAPLDAALDIPVTQIITLTFNEAIRNIDDSEITDVNVDGLLVFKKDSDIGDNVTFDAVIDAGKTLITITPAAALDTAQVYYVALNANAVEDESDNAITDIQSSTFTTVTPLITITYPVGGESFYSGDDITITWTSQHVDNLKIEVYDPVYIEYHELFSSVDASLGTQDFTIPDDAITDSGYKIKLTDITDASVFDESGEITITDTIHPAITSFVYPADDATDISIDSVLILIFSEDVTAMVGNIVIKETVGDAVFETIDVSSASVTIYDGDSVVINPVSNFEYNTGYYVTIESATFMDNSTNGFMGLSNSTTWNFTTEAEPVADLFFSEYIEGSSNNKALEIHNPTGVNVDLTPYVVKLASNANSWGNTLDLTGTLINGGVYVIANAAADAAILDESDITSDVTYYNGNDALGLFKDDVLIDVIGVPESNINYEVAGVTDALAEHTLVRKETIIEGNTDWIASAGTNEANSEWIVYAQDDFTHIGFHPYPPILVTSITVTGEGSATTIVVDDGTLQMYAAILPVDATDQSVTWSVINGTGEAAIDADGLLTAVSDGVVTVKATANDGSDVFGTLDITISNQIPNDILVTDITVTGAGSATTIETDGGTLQMSAEVLPVDATDNTVTWSVVEVTGEATISATGLLTAVSNGTVYAKAIANDASGIKDSLLITISGQIVLVESITVTGAGSATTIETDGGTLQMSAEVLPVDATDNTVTWSVVEVDGEATISATGLLTAVSNGTVYAKAIANDASGVKDSLLITISGQIVLVESITVTGTGGATTIETNAGTLQMSAAVLPADATDNTVTWSVVNGTGEAIISATGLLSAVADGTVTVTATANDTSAVEGTLEITITNQIILVTDITVTGEDGATTIEINKDSLQMSAEVLPADATDKTVTWSVENGTGVATINQAGMLFAVNNGTVIVKATANDASEVEGTLEITLSNQVDIVLVETITVTGEGGAISIDEDLGTLQMYAEVLPENAENKTVTWSVENGTGEATISETGLLSAVANGTVTVIATANDGSVVEGTLEITITNQVVIILVESITVTGEDGATSIDVDKGTLQMSADVLPVDATDNTVTWSVENGTGVATIDETGLLSAVNNGTVMVIATANDGSEVEGTLVITLTNQTDVILVSSITVVAEGGATSIDEDDGTLQMYANILPTDADNTTVTWSVVNGTGSATIDGTALLTAVTDGLVTVVASATDGSGITGTLEITITNQVGINNITLESMITIYPNPSNGKFNIEIVTENTIDNISIEIISSIGQVILTEKIENCLGKYTGQFDISDNRKGIYFIRLMTDDQVAFYRLVIN
ncbi:MAG: Ig-like domain-containing protein [Bacteroidales bacterium]|nr:Ig-like domain-containing protein [Bacteroidales bacterium]